MAIFFVQNITAPLDSEFHLGVRVDASDAPTAAQEFVNTFDVDPGDQIVVVPLNGSWLFDIVQPDPAVVTRDIQVDLPLPEEHT